MSVKNPSDHSTKKLKGRHIFSLLKGMYVRFHENLLHFVSFAFVH